MNRAIGAPPVIHTVTPLAGGGSRLEGEIRLAGVPLARYLDTRSGGRRRTASWWCASCPVGRSSASEPARG
jgi:hypothetical protein